MAFLERVYNIAVRDEKTAGNPAAKLKMLREPSGRTRYLTDGEEERVMAGVPTVPRSKNGEARHLPMTSTVRGVLARLPRSLQSSALVFPNSAGHYDLRW